MRHLSDPNWLGGSPHCSLTTHPNRSDSTADDALLPSPSTGPGLAGTSWHSSDDHHHITVSDSGGRLSLHRRRRIPLNTTLSPAWPHTLAQAVHRCCICTRRGTAQLRTRRVACPLAAMARDEALDLAQGSATACLGAVERLRLRRTPRARSSHRLQPG
eukprot:358566-Chlamydomonas_euryale.AAC.2